MLHFHYHYNFYHYYYQQYTLRKNGDSRPKRRIWSVFVIIIVILFNEEGDWCDILRMKWVQFIPEFRIQPKVSTRSRMKLCGILQMQRKLQGGHRQFSYALTCRDTHTCISISESVYLSVYLSTYISIYKEINTHAQKIIIIIITACTQIHTQMYTQTRKCT